MAKIPDLLKAAIIAMPEKDKDKLLLRLVAKDEILMAQLYHQLLEDESDTREEKQKVLQVITTTMESVNRSYQNNRSSPGLLMMAMRYSNGSISHFAKIHKDKFAEIELTIELVYLAINLNKQYLIRDARKADTFAPYITKKADFILKKLAKIHEDYYFQFEEKLNEILDFIHKYPLCEEFVEDLQIPRKLR